MMNRLFNNWPWKLLSVLFAIILWFMIINYQDPVTSKTIDNVKVGIINEDTITSKNRAVEYLEGNTVNLKLKGKRSVLNTLNKKDVSVKADLSKVSVTGAVDLDVDLPVGVELVRKSPSMMVISIEKIMSKLKTATPFYEGEVASGYIKLEPGITPNQVEITGTESKLALISSVIVPINIENVKDDITLYVKPQILDSLGNEIDGLRISSGTVEVELPVQKIEERTIYVKPFGELSSDYRIEYIKPSLSKVKVRGYAEDLANLYSINISDIDLGTFNENTKRIETKLQNYLPEGIYLMDKDDFYVDVKVDKLLEKEVDILDEDIEFKNEDDDFDYEFAGAGSIPIVLKGSKADLDKIDVDSLNPVIDLAKLSEEGEFTAEVLVSLPKDMELVNGRIFRELLVLKKEDDSEKTTEEETEENDD